MQELEQAVQEAVEQLPPRDDAAGPEQHQDQQVEAPAHQENQQVSDAESRARQQGWVPQDEFHGRPEDWNDADTFLEIGERRDSKERNRRLQEKVEKLERESQDKDREWQDRFERLDKTNQIALQRERERIAASYEARKRDAVEIGDTERYDQLSKDQGEALKSYDESVQLPEPAQPQGDDQANLPPEVQSKLVNWVDANPWMKRSHEMAGAAIDYYNQLENDKPGMTIDELLSATTTHIRGRFPDKFSAGTPAPQPSAVEGGGGRQTNAAASQVGPANLPPEARKAAEEFIAEGLYKDMNEYAAFYFSDANN